MREIKFRAFCKSENRMLSYEHLKEATKGMVDVANAMIEKRCIRVTKPSPYGLFLPLEDEDLEFMQFTGLYDKSGKAIYEGDIVLTQPIKNKPYSKSSKAKRRVGKVVWNSGKRDGSSVVTEPSFIVEFIDKENDYRCWNWSLFYDCEVIGNIYDNPELLKGE